MDVGCGIGADFEFYKHFNPTLTAVDISPQMLNFAKQKAKEEQKKTSRTSTRKSSAMNPIIKVLTSATFIRGVMGILSKAMR